MKKRTILENISSENTEMQDIRKMMDKLLHWAAIIESTDDAIIGKSLDGVITSWNKGAQRLYGYTSEEVIGKSVSILMPSEKEDDFEMIMNMMRQGKRVEHYETKRLTKDGRIIDVSITESPIKDNFGNIIGTSKIARDITDRVEMERRRNEFINTASHELKTPLTSQKVYGELLENLIKKHKDEKYMVYVQKMNQQTQKLTKLIEDLLTVSRIQTHKMYMEQKELHLDDVIQNVIEDFQPVTHHTLDFKKRSGAMVNGDADRLGQVMSNLLSNAIKYSPNADRIEIWSEIKDGNVVTGIKDFGIGIPKDCHEKIFEQFFRADGIDEKTFPGMGIGLHICKEIILRHNGTIWVESEKKKGATFYFSLPCILNSDKK